MIPWVQKPAAEERLTMGRPATGETPNQKFRMPTAEWDDLGRVAGRNRPAVLRQFILWYLRTPGVKLPVRPSADEIDSARSTPAAADAEG